MNKYQVWDKIRDCVDKLYREDSYLFQHALCERCIMFRFAHYLQNEFSGYFVDCEFNKNAFEGQPPSSKVMQNEDGELKKIYTDIIIHRRNSRTEDQLLCLEMKLRKRAWNSDFKRLEKMTNEGGFTNNGIQYVFDYDFGVFLFLPKDQQKSEIHLFINGGEVTQLGNST